MSTYVAIDLKSFYASVECVALGQDPLDFNLVVADNRRSDKTICLAVSPALKQLGVSGRPRLYEVKQKVQDLNYQRYRQVGRLYAKSPYLHVLKKNPRAKVDFQVVPPRMQHYLEKSSEIYEIYLRYIAPEDIHVYSIDEVFMDVTNYLETYKLTAKELVKQIILDIKEETGITATAGIGENMYLAKVALDIVSKKFKADKDSVRMAQLSQQHYRQYLWAHQPLTDFWRVGRGYAKRLEKLGLQTMGDIARCSLGTLSDKMNAEVLYQEFGKNAELLIDHAWGEETTTITDIKAYQPKRHSLGSGQVLMRPYSFQEGLVILREMSDNLALDLNRKKLKTKQLTLTIDYDVKNLKQGYQGALATDYYGRALPKHDHGSYNFERYTDLQSQLFKGFKEIYQCQVNPKMLIRKITVVASDVMPAEAADRVQVSQQLDLFADFTQAETPKNLETENKEHQRQEIVNNLRERFGKNAIIKASSLLEEATGKQRNNQIGGHQS
ncbi:UV-damage repair protein [Ligilactobacillus equi DSM 15833 = JCM 10991]|uniref:UV-damage repair protein n=1 Tax=Ligilactobacillus equi DSM 15833 = JCM 10991 TaxID=1423740 RepID=A0A0R1TL63_9LACO|nr:hypothetical protein [Ligilactobacillus equi]KRL79506.1 UV-damage repair protein [Ligilactobacillus equi DSM 15833 = JCM 10991]